MRVGEPRTRQIRLDDVIRHVDRLALVALRYVDDPGGVAVGVVERHLVGPRTQVRHELQVHADRRPDRDDAADNQDADQSSSLRRLGAASQDRPRQQAIEYSAGRGGQIPVVSAEGNGQAPAHADEFAERPAQCQGGQQHQGGRGEQRARPEQSRRLYEPRDAASGTVPASHSPAFVPTRRPSSSASETPRSSG